MESSNEGETGDDQTAGQTKYAPDDLGTYEVRDKQVSSHRASYYIDLGTAVVDALGHPDRISIVIEDAVGYLVAGVVDEAVADYAVASRVPSGGRCSVESVGCRKLGVVEGDKIRCHEDGDRVRLEIIAGDGGRDGQ